jgi:hypothetical protein
MVELMESAKLIIEVVAGLLPGKDPEPEFTKRWAVTSDQWYAAGTDEAKLDLLADRGGKADEYAASLRNPGRFNWVRTDWVWL